MEYLIPPAILVLLIRFGFPTLVTWFFERFVEPQAESATQQQGLTTQSVTETTDAQTIAATRKELDRLRQRLDNTNGS